MVHCTCYIVSSIFFLAKNLKNNVTGRCRVPLSSNYFCCKIFDKGNNSIFIFSKPQIAKLPLSKWQFAPFQYCYKIFKNANLNQWHQKKQTINNILGPNTCHQFFFPLAQIIPPLHWYAAFTVNQVLHVSFFYLWSWEQIRKQVQKVV